MIKRFFFLFLISTTAFAQIDRNSISQKMTEMPADFTRTTSGVANYIEAYFNTDEDNYGLLFTGLQRLLIMI